MCFLSVGFPKSYSSSMDKDGLMQKTGIEYLLGVNELHSREFLELQEQRRIHRKRHPTEIAALKCMDGRLHLPKMTETPLGIIQPYRNLGGKFDLGWPFFQQAILKWFEYAESKGRDCLILVTYHYSRGEKHRGCKGFAYDTEAAREFSRNLKAQFDADFGPPRMKQPTGLYAMHVGIETDWDSLILHDESGQPHDLADFTEISDDKLLELLCEWNPTIAERAPNVLEDFVPVAKGNIAHIKKVRIADRKPTEIDHQEWVAFLGRGADWLHLPNTALIVGPWQPDFSEPIRIAASLIKSNLDNNSADAPIRRHGPVLMTSGIYYRTDTAEPYLAARKSKDLRDEAMKIIRAEVPDLLPHLKILATTVNMNTRKFNVLKD